MLFRKAFQVMDAVMWAEFLQKRSYALPALLVNVLACLLQDRGVLVFHTELMFGLDCCNLGPDGLKKCIACCRCWRSLGEGWKAEASQRSLSWHR